MFTCQHVKGATHIVYDGLFKVLIIEATLSTFGIYSPDSTGFRVGKWLHEQERCHSNEVDPSSEWSWMRFHFTCYFLMRSCCAEKFVYLSLLNCALFWISLFQNPCRQKRDSSSKWRVIWKTRSPISLMVFVFFWTCFDVICSFWWILSCGFVCQTLKFRCYTIFYFLSVGMLCCNRVHVCKNLMMICCWYMMFRVLVLVWLDNEIESMRKWSTPFCWIVSSRKFFLGSRAQSEHVTSPFTRSILCATEFRRKKKRLLVVYPPVDCW